MDFQLIAGFALSAVIGATGGILAQRAHIRMRFPEDLVDNLSRVQREWVAFLEDAENILANVEKKRKDTQLERARTEKALLGPALPEAIAPVASIDDERRQALSERRGGFGRA